MSKEKPEIIARKRHSRFMRWRIRRRLADALAPAPRHSEPFRRFREGLGGELPGPGGGDGIVLAACTDFYYWQFAVTLVLSIERQETAQRLHLHLCRPSPDALSHIRRLAKGLTHVRLTWTTDACRLAEGLRYPTVYYTSARFLVGALIHEQTQAPLLAIDVDGIAARPVWPAFDAARSGADIVLIRRPEETSDARRILASAAGFGPSPMGLRFTAALGRGLAAVLDLKPAYHVDQIALHYLSQMLAAEGLKVAEMPKALSDYAFDANAVLWTAKGWQQKTSSAYADAKARIDGAYPHLIRTD